LRSVGDRRGLSSWRPLTESIELFRKASEVFSTISDLYRQLTEIDALMSLMHFEKIRGNSLKISKY